ncbi:MAG: hypothetical protein M1833_003105 [Piccolia ochrophora]|nr:MAG: hypothetical protein M1833_003105 [Piccolia ochrophora]
MAVAYHREREIAELAVQRAALLTKKVFHDQAKGTQSKDDKSPVTIADFGAQALITRALKHNFPSDTIVGEEDADLLRRNAGLRDQVWDLVKNTHLQDDGAESGTGGVPQNAEQLLDELDSGAAAGGSTGRFWTIDPVDGTKGFLRGGQYAVCLALIENGDVKVGVLGCPNLPIESEALTGHQGSNQSDGEGNGVLFSAVKGQGALARALGSGSLQPATAISMNSVADIHQATFCESVEAGHSSHDDQSAIAERLGITNASVRMDSQAKYASLARGAGDIYLRLPTRKDYQEKIWDHAAGDLIVRESGGQVTDVHGQRLDFGKGRTLASNTGVIAAYSEIHTQVLEAVKAVIAREDKL